MRKEGDVMNPRSTDKEAIIMNTLVEETKKAGHQLSNEEIRANANLPAPEEYAYHFGSADNAARTAWRKVHVEEKGITLTPLALALLKKQQEKKE